LLRGVFYWYDDDMQEKTIVAKAFVINSDGLILVLRRSKTAPTRPLTWDLPGGGVDFGEDPTEAVIREAKEEAELDLKDVRVFITKTTNKEKYVVRLLYFAYTDTTKVVLSFEHDDYRWVTKKEFDELGIPNLYKDCLHHVPQ
jgi:8-oxo-dGTP diphosphatase